MIAALWQGELMAALGAVVEDVDLLSPVPETNRRGSRHSSSVMAVRGNAAFFEMLLEKVLCADGGAGSFR